MEAASTSETSVNFYQTTRRNNPEDNHQGDRLDGGGSKHPRNIGKLLPDYTAQQLRIQPSYVNML
jgi:hypothetical protein